MYQIVLDAQKVLIFWSAKCGCSSIKRIIAQFLKVNPKDVHTFFGYGEPNKIYSRFDHEQIEKYKEYTVVLLARNPYERLVSSIVDRVAVGKPCHRKLPTDVKTFRDFVQYYSKDHDLKTIDNHHLVPQISEDGWSNYKKLLQIGKPFDRIYDLSEIGELVQLLEERFGEKTTKTQYHSSQYDYYYDGDASNIPLSRLRSPYPLPKYFYPDDQTREKVYQIYFQDFEFFRKHGLDYSRKFTNEKHDNLQTLCRQFYFIPCTDSTGHDIKRSKSQDLSRMLQESLDTPECIAINTNGWMKHTVKNLDIIPEFSNSQGIYLKMTALKTLGISKTRG